MEILIGCDPEVFAFDSNGVVDPVFFPGTKRHPKKSSVGKGSLQKDGLAMEFNTEPSRSKSEFLSRVKDSLFEVQTLAQKNSCKMEITPTVRFSLDFFDSLSDETRELGCDPDYCSYTGDEKLKPNQNALMRTGGGHVHIGWGQGIEQTKDHFKFCQELVKQLDSVLFLSSIFWDDDKTRREMYGKIGSFRTKSYGLEYRPLSNKWLSDDLTIEFIYEASVRAVNDFLEGIYYYEVPQVKQCLELFLSEEEVDPDFVIEALKSLNEATGAPVFYNEG